MKFLPQAITILVKAKHTSPVYHTGNKACFFQQLTKRGKAAIKGKPEPSPWAGQLPLLSLVLIGQHLAGYHLALW